MDDMVIAASSRDAIIQFKNAFSKHFEITDQGEVSWLLGFEVKHDRKARTIAINQKAYLMAMAEKFRLTNAKPAYMPMEPGMVFSKEQCPSEPIHVPYQEACGSILWPAVTSRPDIQFAVGILA